MALNDRKASERGTRQQDAIALLRQDHRKLQKLFDLYRESDDDTRKGRLCEQACMLLTIHADIEETIFYPAAQLALDDADAIDEAMVEHDMTRSFVEQLQEDDLRLDKRDSIFEVLGELISHHIGAEESGLFRQLRKTDLDLHELADEMRERKQEMLAELEVDTDEEDEDSDEATESRGDRYAGSMRMPSRSMYAR